MDASFERSFAQALLDPALAVPPGVVADTAQSARRRLAVHRTNMVAGLQKAMAARFPAVEKIVGTDFFAALARAFVTTQPPRTPLLATYGDDFPDFIGTFAQARELAYLADVARLEAARARAYHAADATPLAAQELAAIAPDALIGLRVKLHPSLEIVHSEHPIVTIWAMNCGEQKLEAIDNWCREDALVVRPHLEVEVRLLPPGGATFLLALADGRSLGTAADAAVAESPQFDLTDSLAALIGWGLVCGVVVPPLSTDGPR